MNTALKLLVKTPSQGEVGWLVPAPQLVLGGRDRTRFKPLADKLDSASQNSSGSRAQKPKPRQGQGCYSGGPSQLLVAVGHLSLSLAYRRIVLAAASMAKWISYLCVHLCPSVLSL